jgi:hypothetical protein
LKLLKNKLNCRHNYLVFSVKCAIQVKVINNLRNHKCTSSSHSLFFEKFKNNIYKIQNILKINQDIDNVGFHNRAKFQLKIPFRLGCAKITNLTYVLVNSSYFQYFKIYQILLFLWASNISYFKEKLCMFVEDNISYI